jgi:hypothetical protein
LDEKLSKNYASFGFGKLKMVLAQHFCAHDDAESGKRVEGQTNICC